MNKTRKNMWLYISLGAILLFVLAASMYFKESPLPYPGPWPLILITGAVVITLCTALVFSGIRLWKYKFHWQALTTIALNAIVMIPLSYALWVWIIFTI